MLQQYILLSYNEYFSAMQFHGPSEAKIIRF